MNVKIFERFRIANDEFFSKKAEFFKTIKSQYAENLEKKQKLVEKAKALADSTEWKKLATSWFCFRKSGNRGLRTSQAGRPALEGIPGCLQQVLDARNKEMQAQETRSMLISKRSAASLPSSRIWQRTLL